MLEEHSVDLHLQSRLQLRLFVLAGHLVVVVVFGHDILPHTVAFPAKVLFADIPQALQLWGCMIV